MRCNEIISQGRRMSSRRYPKSFMTVVQTIDRTYMINDDGKVSYGSSYTL